MGFPLLDWSQIFSHLLNVALAYVLALPLGWERERSTSGPGLRTFPLVAIASCGYILIARSVIGIGADEQSRVLQGLLSGIGFIGGGAILKERGSVTGTATAASLWNTGAIGTAVAYGRYEIALVLSVINFATLRLLTPLKRDAEEQAAGNTSRRQAE
jgi:putative Mg2+ transporter-C (MgtC) family protein